MLFDDPRSKGQKTRLENQFKAHHQRMEERHFEVEQMRLSFPAPELLDMLTLRAAA